MDFEHISALVFDFDGTLATCPYDFPYMRRSVLEAADEFDIPHEKLDGLGLLETIETGATLLTDQLRARDFREEAMRRLCAIEYEAAAVTRLLPGTRETLRHFRRAGMRLGVVTRNSMAAVARIIGDVPLPVDALLCREDVRRPKPHPDHLKDMLRLLGRAPAQALMVGDHPTDIEVGKAAGMGTVAVTTGQSSAEDLHAARPDFLLNSVVELAPLLLSGKTFE